MKIKVHRKKRVNDRMKKQCKINVKFCSFTQTQRILSLFMNIYFKYDWIL